MISSKPILMRKFLNVFDEFGNVLWSWNVNDIEHKSRHHKICQDIPVWLLKKCWVLQSLHGTKIQMILWALRCRKNGPHRFKHNYSNFYFTSWTYSSQKRIDLKQIGQIFKWVLSKGVGELVLPRNDTS